MITPIHNENLVKKSGAQRTTLRKQTYRTQLRLGETTVADEQRVHVARIKHSHAVRSDDAALVLICQTNNLVLHVSAVEKTHFCRNSLLCSGLAEPSRNNRHPLCTTLQALLESIHSKLGRNRNNYTLDLFRNVQGTLVNGLAKELTTLA